MGSLLALGWKNSTKVGNNRERQLERIIEKFDDKYKKNIQRILRKWLYNSQVVKSYFYSSVISLFCRKILYRINKKYQLEDAQKKWHKLSYQLKNGDIKMDISEILEQIRISIVFFKKMRFDK